MAGTLPDFYEPPEYDSGACEQPESAGTSAVSDINELTRGALRYNVGYELTMPEMPNDVWRVTSHEGDRVALEHVHGPHEVSNMIVSGEKLSADMGKRIEAANNNKEHTEPINTTVNEEEGNMSVEVKSKLRTQILNKVKRFFQAAAHYLTALSVTGITVRPTVQNGEVYLRISPIANIQGDSHQPFTEGTVFSGKDNKYYKIFARLKEEGITFLSPEILEANGVGVPYVSVEGVWELELRNHHTVWGAKTAGLPIAVHFGKQLPSFC